MKLTRQRFERGIGNRANHPQRVIGPDPLLKIYVAERLPQIVSSPRIVTPFPHPKDHNAQISPPFFSTLLVLRSKQLKPLCSPSFIGFGGQEHYDVGTK